MATTNTTAFTVKLVIDTANQRVLFAVASKEVVDYLHSLVAPEVSLAFEKATVAGCIAHLYDSVELLDAATRNISAPCSPPALSSTGQTMRFFQCGYKHSTSCANYVTETRGASCPSCGREMAAVVPPGSPGAGCSGENASAGGRAAECVMCLLKDDLTVMPVPASGLALASSLALCVLMMSVVVSPAAIQKRTVPLGYTEAMAILEASLQSSSVLTDVFLGNKPSAIPSAKSIQNMK